MDWKKIKLRLILLLLCLNIGLGLNYSLSSQDQEAYQISKESINILIDQLEKKGISVNVDLDDKNVYLKPLLVQYQEKDPDYVNEAFFQAGGQLEEEEEGITRISLGHQEITIINNKRLIYENLSKSSVSTNTDPEELCKNFLIDKGFSMGDMVLIKKDIEGDRTFLEYAKIYDQKIIETSYTRFEIEHGTIRMMDRLWIDVIGEDTEDIAIEPSYKAVMSLLTDELYYNTSINSVDLCYYFNPEDHGIIDDNTHAQRGRAMPAWRLEFDSGHTKIVDNY